MEIFTEYDIAVEYTLDLENGNCHIKDSYLINNRAFMLNFIINVLLPHKIFKSRSMYSYLYEWIGHNKLYSWGLFKNSTKDVDLNIKEPLYRRLIYFILSLF